jgi:hypothetical protein
VRSNATTTSASTNPRTTGTPGITFTSVPSVGGTTHLAGRVSNANPKLYRVVVFIKVDGIWWVKPYWDSPLTSIAADGTWTCQIATGGHDQDATAIEAFVVRADLRLPSEPTLSDVQPHAVAQTHTSR